MKNLFIRLFVVLVFLIGAFYVINHAPHYELEYKYKNGDLRVILNDKEITREKSKLPEVATIMNGEVMLSSNTIDILFDKDLYFEKKYDTFITTNGNHRADIAIGSNHITIDGENQSLKTPAISVDYEYANDDRYEGSNNKKEVYYIPIKALEEIYNITVDFEDKVIISTNDVNMSNFVVNTEENVEIKYMEDNNSKTIDTAKNGDIVYVFDYDGSKEFYKVRSQNGELGYLSNSVVSKYSLETISTIPEDTFAEYKNVTLAWDYINPISTDIGTKNERTKVNNLNVVSPTILFLEDSTGNIYYNANVLREYLNWANSCNYEVWLTVKNERINDNKTITIDDLSEFLNDMHSRAKAIRELINICKEYKVAGLDVDFENIYKEDATAFSQFIRELGVECRNNNITLCVCTNIPDGSDTWSLCYQHKALSEAVDYIVLMTYDFSRGTVSSFAPYTWVEDNIKKVVERDGVEASKLILGISFGSAYWKVTDGTASRSIINMSSAKKYINNNWDEDLKQYVYQNDSKGEYVYVEEKASIKEKLGLIDKYGLGGSGAWQLGQETSDVWEAYDN